MKNPIPWTFEEIIKATGAELISGNKKCCFNGISINSRQISTGDLFVAIKGKNHDGHDFINHALSAGATGFLANKERIAEFQNTHKRKRGLVCGLVKNTIKALGDLASFNIKRSGVSVVAITGSSGKTTTKEMTASILSKRFNTLSTIGNYNNNIGLPLTVFKLNSSHDWAVLELGMNKPKEIEELATICAPDIGIITNIGHAHLKAFDSINGIMDAKGELLGKIKQDGVVILNADDPRAVQLGERTSKRILFYGTGDNAAIKAEKIKEKTTGISFTMILPKATVDINLKAHGKFMVSNGLAAASAGFLAGLSAAEIQSGLEDFKPVDGRMNILKTESGINLIDDTYNANPDSMKAAITTLISLKKDKRGILVLGDMLELGKDEKSMHTTLGSLAADSGAAKIYLTGRFSARVADGALNKGMTMQNIFTGTKKEIIKDLTQTARRGDWILVKGSRGAHMENIVSELIKDNRNKDNRKL